MSELERRLRISKPIVLSFYHLWSTTCKPCKAELPKIISLGRLLAQKKVQVFIIAEEESVSLSKARDFFVSSGGNASQFTSQIEPPKQMDLRARLRAPGLGVLPITALVDNQGNRLFFSRQTLQPGEEEKIFEFVAKESQNGRRL